MKKYRLAAVLCTAIIVASAFTGCSGSDGNGEVVSETTVSEQQTMINTAPAVVDTDETNQDISTETRPIEEGDDYAINKINNKSETLPGGYELADYSEENQGKMYLNGSAQLVIRGYNYNEDMQDMAVWADNACALMSISNITYACDTVFGEPENVTVCGFDGIKYDYEIIQYDFIADENDPEAEAVKTEIYRQKARIYFFYSEQDAYVVYFNTMAEDWEEQLGYFEEFVADLEVTKTEY